jgi:hypothetical protein
MPKQAVDLVGRTFGKWLVLRRAEKNDKHCRIQWVCRCECSREQEVLGQSLISGNSTRCRSCASAIAGHANKGRKCPENARLALIERNKTRRGVVITSEKALTSVRAACKKMNEVRHLQARHILSNVDSEALTAECQICGRVPIKVLKHRHEKWNVRDQYLCWVGSLRVNGEYADARVRFRDQALQMFESQNNACAICSRPMIRGNGLANDGMVLDHCHTTRFIRGFTHQRCNKGIAMFVDDPRTLRKAAEYLELSASKGAKERTSTA